MTLAAIAGTILGAAAVLAVQMLRRHQRNRSQVDCDLSLAAVLNQVEDGTGRPALNQVESKGGDPIPVAVVPPASNGDSATPNLDRILAERAAEQRDDPD